MAKSNLRLTEEQENALLVYLKERLAGLKKSNNDRIEVDKRGFRDYQNSKEYRKSAGEDTIWNHSNVSVPLYSLVVDYFMTRSSEEILGNKPFFHARPKGPSDKEIALRLDRYLNNRFDDLKIGEKLEDNLLPIFTQRAGIYKAVYEERYDQWEEYDKVVLFDSETSQPVEVIDHGFVVEGEDRWIDTVDELTGEPVMILEADDSIVLDSRQLYYWDVYQEPIAFQEELYRGPNVQTVDTDCFFAPMDAETLDAADCLAELYDKPLNWVKQRFMEGRSWLKWSDYKASLSSLTAERKTDSERKKEAKENLSFDYQNGKLPIAEFWIQRDVRGLGAPQRIAVWVDVQNWVIIFAEYQAVLTPDKKSPFIPIPIWRQKNYWWGPSLCEMLQVYQDYVDKQFNRHSHRNAINANPIIGEHPEATVEEKSLRDMKPFEVATLREGRQMQDWLEAFVFPNADHDTQDLIGRIFYWVQLWLGVSNLAQGDYSDLPANTTAYGMDASLRESGRLSRRWSRKIMTGFEYLLVKLAKIEFATMDEERVYTYTEGDEELTDVMQRMSVQGMEFDISLVVAQQPSQTVVEANRLTIEITEKYAVMMPSMQLRLRPVMLQSLAALGHMQADDLLPRPTPEMLQAEAMGLLTPAEEEQEVA